MANVNVIPDTLKSLSDKQIAASDYAVQGANALNGTGGNCWLTHGVISGSSNSAFNDIEGIRKAAGMALAKASTDMAAKLLTAKKAYEGVDSELAGNINKQMLDK